MSDMESYYGALRLAGIKAERARADGLPTHGGAAELAARLAEHLGDLGSRRSR
jgi:hypothetical protein